MPRYDDYQIPPRQAVGDRSATIEAEIGQKIRDDMGRVWYYGQASESIAHGCLAAQNAGQSEELAATDIAATAAGATQVTVIAASVTANEFAGGFLSITDAAGEGYMYLILRHGAANASTGAFTLTLHPSEPILVALTAASVGVLIKGLYSTLLIANKAEPSAELMAGVASADFTTSYPYGWFQTWGPAMCLVGADGVTAGMPVSLSDDVDGAVEDVGDVNVNKTGHIVGVAMNGEATTEYAPIFLTISQ